MAPVLHMDHYLCKRNMMEAYYNFRLRRVEEIRLAFSVESEIYMPLCNNRGISVAPWFLTKA